MRQLCHLMNFFLMKGSLSALCWVDMARAAVYVMNRLAPGGSTLRTN